MERRQFLKYIGLAATGVAFAACGNNGNSSSSGGDSTSGAKKPGLDFSKLEKTDLKIGIVSVTDSAPLIIAKEKGFFQKYGLNVTISKEPGWSGVRTGLLKGRLDASQALFGMPMFALLGPDKAPMVSLMTLDLNGNAITLSKQAWDRGIRPATEYLNFQEFTDSFYKYIKGSDKTPTFGIEYPISMGGYNLRYWLSAMKINPDKDVKLIAFGPRQMVDKLKSGMIDAYCVSEPWNQRAVFEQVGFTADVSRNIWSGHPEKVLATMESWIQENPTTARALVAAVLEACQYCDVQKNRLPVVNIISDPQYLNAKVEYVKAAMLGKYDYGGFDGKARVKDIPDFNLFHFLHTNYLKQPDNANYPWRSHAVWLLTQMIRWSQLEQKEYPKDADQIIDRAYPVEIYSEVAKALKIPFPSERMKVEPADIFLDKVAFDPSKPVEYLNSFELRAQKPQIFALS